MNRLCVIAICLALSVNGTPASRGNGGNTRGYGSMMTNTVNGNMGGYGSTNGGSGQTMNKMRQMMMVMKGYGSQAPAPSPAPAPMMGYYQMQSASPSPAPAPVMGYSQQQAPAPAPAPMMVSYGSQSQPNGMVMMMPSGYGSQAQAPSPAPVMMSYYQPSSAPAPAPAPVMSYSSSSSNGASSMNGGMNGGNAKCNYGDMRAVAGNDDVFEVCVHGNWMEMPCAPGTWYDENSQKCTNGEEVSNGGMTNGGTQNGGRTYGTTTNGGMKGGNTQSSGMGYGNTNNGGTTKSGYAATMNQMIMMAGLSNGKPMCDIGSTLALADDPSRYLECVFDTSGGTVMVIRECGTGTLFNEHTQNCGDHDPNYVAPTPTNNGGNNGGYGSSSGMTSGSTGYQTNNGAGPQISFGYAAAHA